MHVTKQALSFFRATIVGMEDELRNYKLNLIDKLEGDKPKDYEDLFYKGELIVGFIIGSIMTLERQLKCIYENKKFEDRQAFKVHDNIP